VMTANQDRAAVFEKLKKDLLRAKALPAKQRGSTPHAEKYAFPIGLDDEGRPYDAPSPQNSPKKAP
jgi:hypothetical protein